MSIHVPPTYRSPPSVNCSRSVFSHLPCTCTDAMPSGLSGRRSGAWAPTMVPAASAAAKTTDHVSLMSGLVSSSGSRQGASLGHDHERQETRGGVGLRRSARRVNGPERFEERTARRHDPFRLIVDGKAELPVHDVPEHRPGMTMSRA